MHGIESTDEKRHIYLCIQCAPEEERERFDAIRLSEEDSLDGKPEASATVGDEAEILPVVSNIDEDALPELPDFAAK